MGLRWEQKLEPGHTKLRKKLVGAYGGSREAWYESKVQYQFLTGLSGGYLRGSSQILSVLGSFAQSRDEWISDSSSPLPLQGPFKICAVATLPSETQ